MSYRPARHIPQKTSSSFKVVLKKLIDPYLVFRVTSIPQLHEERREVGNPLILVWYHLTRFRCSYLTSAKLTRVPDLFHQGHLLAFRNEIMVSF